MKHIETTRSRTWAACLFLQVFLITWKMSVQLFECYYTQGCPTARLTVNSRSSWTSSCFHDLVLWFSFPSKLCRSNWLDESIVLVADILMCHSRKSTGGVNRIDIVSAQGNTADAVEVLLTVFTASQAYSRFRFTDTFLLVICAPSTLHKKSYKKPPLGVQMVYRAPLGSNEVWRYSLI